MKPYEYQILRYCHDRITGEFINVGILLFSPTERLLLIKTIDRYKRLNEFFPESNGNHIRKLVNQLENVAVKLRKRITQQLDFDKLKDIDTIANFLLPKDDSALYFSEPLKGLAIDMEHTVQLLFDSIVSKHDKFIDKKSLSDEEVWRNIYKKYFDEKEITDKLTSHSIKTKNDSFDFDLCWRNEVWHIYKPISFELTDHNKIKNKIYHYNGILNELLTTEESVSIIYLATRPKFNDQHKLIELMKEKLLSEQSNVKTNIVFEEEAEKLTNQLKLEMDSH